MADHSLAKRLTRFLDQQLVLPVVLSSLLGVLFYLGRVWWSGHTYHFFLMWNLFLAWIPFLCALSMAVLYSRRALAWQYVIPSLVWLAFFPNAAYLVTDLVNLNELPPVPYWYDVAFFATMAWTGLLLAVASLQIVQRMVRQTVGVIASWILVFAVIGLNGVGIYLGRFLRWNSWDVLTEPVEILRDAVMPFLHPIAYRQSVAVILVFSALLFVCYLSVLALQKRAASSELQAPPERK